MSFPASQIIQINANISPTGLGNANFASAMLFAPNGELPVGFTADTIRTYFTLTALMVDFPSTTETYLAAQKWLGGTPATAQIMVYGTATADATVVITLGKARNTRWWYWTIFTAPVLAVLTNPPLIAAWCESVGSMFINSQTGSAATAIRANTALNIANVLTTSGYRHAYTPSHATDGYSGVALAKHFAAVNYSGDNTTITGEFKKSPGVAAEDLLATAYTNMMLATNKSPFYSVVDNQGSVDSGRWLNTFTHSSYGEYIDDVVNLDACINALTTELYNATANAIGKLPQTPAGQAILIAAARRVLKRYIANGYLGPRTYTNPDDGLDYYTIGFEILTKPEDILTLSSADRGARKSAALRCRLFRAGAIHSAIIALDIY